MKHSHKPYYRGTEAHCASCGLFLWDTRTGARLDALTDVDPKLVEAAKGRLRIDPELAYQLAHEDMHEIVGSLKFSDKFHDELMNKEVRPDLQKPQHQDFLNKVKDTHLNPKTDAIMPWLTQEWKDGHIRLHPGGTGLQFQGHPDYDYEDVDGSNTNWHNLSEQELAHWADWFASNHPTTTNNDEPKTSELHKLVRRWEKDLRDKRYSVFMDEGQPGTCPTCGDVLNHGKCKRCDWENGPSNAMTDGEPITDQTKEVKPAIQSKVAGRSMAEWERLKAKLEQSHGSSQSKTIHEFPDEWTIQQHTQPQDVQRMGEMMANCWKGDFTQKRGTHYYTLHDPVGRPKIALEGYGDPTQPLPERLGMPLTAFNINPTNSPTTTGYLNRMTDWAQQQGFDRYTANAQFSGHPLQWNFDKNLRDSYQGGWTQDDDPVRQQAFQQEQERMVQAKTSKWDWDPTKTGRTTLPN